MIALVLALGVASLPAIEARIKEGVEARRRGEDAIALDKFREAYRLSNKRSSRALAQIAFAEQALGRLLEAEKHLLQAMGDRRDPWIKNNRRVLGLGLTSIQENIGSVYIRVSVDDARVVVNGEEAGRSPLSGGVRARAGTVVVEVHKDGYWPMTRRLELNGGSAAREEFKLVPRPQLPVPRPPATKSAEGSQEPARPTPEAEVAVNVPRGDNLDVYGYVAGGVSIASAGVGLGMLFLRNGHANDFNDCTADVSIPISTCEDIRDSVDATQIGMIAGFAAAGVFAVTSLVLFLVDEDEAESLAGCGVTVNEAGVFCALSF